MEAIITGIGLSLAYAYFYKIIKADAKEQIELYKEGFQKGFEAKHGFKPYVVNEESENSPISTEDYDEDEPTFKKKERWE